MSDEPKRDRLGEVITDAVVRLREFNRMASQDCEPDDFSDADVSFGLREIYGEPPEGTSDSCLLADICLVCAAYEMMRCERDALLRKAGAK